MQDQDVEAIGGPNITPLSDGWVAKCVAASPGNPSHGMVPIHNLHYRVWMIHTSLDRTDSFLTPRWDRFFRKVH